MNYQMNKFLSKEEHWVDCFTFFCKIYLACFNEHPIFISIIFDIIEACADADPHIANDKAFLHLHHDISNEYSSQHLTYSAFLFN